MCLISIAGKGCDKYSDFFLQSIRAGAQRNSDYHGFGFKKAKTGALFIHKGFIEMKDLINALKEHKLTEDDELIVHSRTSSAGAVTRSNSHPFILDPHMERILAPTLGPTVLHYPLMFHNGTFSEFKSDPKEGGSMSDTYNFASNFMRVPDIWNMFTKEPDKFHSNFSTLLGINRLAFLSREYDIKTYGNFISVYGYRFSNSGYVAQTATYKGAFSRQPEEAKILKLDLKDPLEEPLKIGIKINKSNFGDFILRATANMPIDNIKAGENLQIMKYHGFDGSAVLKRVEDSCFKWTKGENLNTCFQLIPKGENKQLYIDYSNLHAVISGTQSAIKKQYSALLTHLSRRSHRDTIDIKYNHSKMTVRVDALVMFLEDYPDHIPSKSMESVRRSLETSEV